MDSGEPSEATRSRRTSKFAWHEDEPLECEHDRFFGDGTSSAHVLADQNQVADAS